MFLVVLFLVRLCYGHGHRIRDASSQEQIKQVHDNAESDAANHSGKLGIAPWRPVFMLLSLQKLVDGYTVGMQQRLPARLPASVYNPVDGVVVGRQQGLSARHSGPGSGGARGHHPWMNIDDEFSQSVPASNIGSHNSLQVPRAAWPTANSRFHRFISQDDPSFEKQARGVTYSTRQKFLGTRREGVHNGSFRLQFTLPGEDNTPKAIELLPLSEGEPTFAAVKVKLKLGAVIKSLPPDFFMQVEDVRQGSNADSSGIMKGDIIRAVSLADGKEQRDGLSQLWQQTAKLWRNTFGVPVPIGSIPVPDSEESMVILDGGYFADVYAALEENKRVNGDNAELVLLVERPSSPSEDLDHEH